MEFSNTEKQKLLKLARLSIETSFTKKDLDLTEYREFDKNLGVFVTLKLNNELRGCIGYPEAYYPLNDSIFKAARAAAFHDPRFMPLEENELKKVKIEISVLTKPKLIKVKDYDGYKDKIDIGKDGLIIEQGQYSGLLLPQVPIELNWDILEYLENLCYKAGLSKDAWTENSTKIYKFQAIVFHE